MNSKWTRIEADFANLLENPHLRRNISDYHPNDTNQIGRAYLQKRPCQPINNCFFLIEIKYYFSN